MILNLFEPVTEIQKNLVNRALFEMPPRLPGVYTMYDSGDAVLYVGKAKDLRKRIYSYRYAKNKKTQQLIAHVSRIGFEICKTETDAELLENLLIRSIKPPFNVLNKQPETYYYLSTVRSGNKREFRLSMKPMHDYPRCYGCFKGHLRVRHGFGAMLKFLFMMDKPLQSAHFLPAQLVGKITPLRFKINLSGETGVHVHQLLEGTSAAFLDHCNELLRETQFKDIFSQRYFEKELELLKLFYESGPARNHSIKTTFNLNDAVIPQDRMDDLQILYSKYLVEN